ncbi:hypothetical protein [Polaromonas sp.]|uniref:hypothetical protein n=1 Tax=Polaromonas sp. TaxID=1869339 RepID=UPI003BAB5EF8
MLHKALLIFVLTFSPLLAGASEFADRNLITAEMQVAFRLEDFTRTEKRYAEINKNNERLSSGILKSDEMLYAISKVLSLPREWPDREENALAKKEREARQEAFLVSMEEKTARWQKAYPASSLAAFARSDAYIKHAFFHRGTRLANEVDPAKWKAFDSYIEKAYAALATPQITKDAAWYGGLLKVAQFRRADLKQFAELVNEASTRYPYSYSIYFFASYRLQPRWGGSVEAFEWLADLAVSKTKPIDGTALYARVYWNISSLGFDDDLFTSTRASWPKMKKGFDDMIKVYPSEWNLNNYARFACMAKDGATLKRILVQIGNEMNPQVWDKPEVLTRCRRLANDA